MYSDIITAHSVVHERGQRASIQPQKAELQNSFFHVEAEEALSATTQKSAEQEGL